jgi:hypothetical protein
MLFPVPAVAARKNRLGALNEWMPSAAVSTGQAQGCCLHSPHSIEGFFKRATGPTVVWLFCLGLISQKMHKIP